MNNSTSSNQQAGKEEKLYRWVKASERLPEEKTEVLWVTDEGEPPMFGYYEKVGKNNWLVFHDSSGEEESEYLKEAAEWLEELPQSNNKEIRSAEGEERLVWVDLLDDIDIYREKFKDEDTWTPMIDTLKGLGYSVQFHNKEEVNEDELMDLWEQFKTKIYDQKFERMEEAVRFIRMEFYEPMKQHYSIKPKG